MTLVVGRVAGPRIATAMCRGILSERVKMIEAVEAVSFDLRVSTRVVCRQISRRECPFDALQVAADASRRRLGVTKRHVELFIVVVRAAKRISDALAEAMKIHPFIHLHADVAEVIVKEGGRIARVKPHLCKLIFSRAAP